MTWLYDMTVWHDCMTWLYDRTCCWWLGPPPPAPHLTALNPRCRPAHAAGPGPGAAPRPQSGDKIYLLLVACFRQSSSYVTWDRCQEISARKIAPLLLVLKVTLLPESSQLHDTWRWRGPASATDRTQWRDTDLLLTLPRGHQPPAPDPHLMALWCAGHDITTWPMIKSVQGFTAWQFVFER